MLNLGSDWLNSAKMDGAMRRRKHQRQWRHGGGENIESVSEEEKPASNPSQKKKKGREMKKQLLLRKMANEIENGGTWRSAAWTMAMAWSNNVDENINDGGSNMAAIMAWAAAAVRQQAFGMLRLRGRDNNAPIVAPRLFAGCRLYLPPRWHAGSRCLLDNLPHGCCSIAAA
jgi:hypothetical protein